MSENNKKGLSFKHHQVVVDEISIHVVESGLPGKPAILFLHGFPESWAEYEQVMSLLNKDFYVLALDLPGIGESQKISNNRKYFIAKYINKLIETLNLNKISLVGHDVGGMIVYACLKAYPGKFAKAVIMNTAIPGIDPWDEIKRNPNIWHFAFSAIPNLPEILVTGKQRDYFDYFFNTISANPNSISEKSRVRYVEAYSSADSLRTGFDWYRTFVQDEKDNINNRATPVQTPVLYVRGEREYGNIEHYLKGFHESSLCNIKGQIVTGSGHYAPEEQPGEVANILTEFING
jgi:pimeloyl-ACP methyl ester carboxylesterase